MKVNSYRTNTCGELTIEDLGKKVTLSGFVSTIRDHGGVMFLDLREHISKNVKSNTKQYKDVKEGLKKMGYKPKEIDKVLPNIYIANGTTELVFKEALRRLQNVKAFG